MRIAVDAMRAAERPHVFLSLTKAGQSAIFNTRGNRDTHVILRGGERPNYDTESVAEAAEAMSKAGLKPNLMIDFSHANSRKRHEKQIDVGEDVAHQIGRGNRNIIGVMIESHLVGGRQDLVKGTELTYGQSITDACLAWKDSEPLLEMLAEAVRKRRKAATGSSKRSSRYPRVSAWAAVQNSSNPALRNHSFAFASSRSTPLPSRYIMPIVVIAPCRPCSAALENHSSAFSPSCSTHSPCMYMNPSPCCASPMPDSAAAVM